MEGADDEDDSTSTGIPASSSSPNQPTSFLDFAVAPNSPDARALRQYAAEKELEAELHQEQVKKLMLTLQEKDDEMAELENRLRLVAASTTNPSTVFDVSNVLDWNPFGHSKKAANRIKCVIHSNHVCQPVKTLFFLMAASCASPQQYFYVVAFILCGYMNLVASTLAWFCICARY